jgi:hypothetical protein
MWIALAFAANSLRFVRRSRRLARSTSWRPMGLAPAANGRDLVVDPPTGAVFASVRTSTRTKPADEGPRVSPVLVAGDVEPGGIMVAAHNGIAATILWRASAADIPRP